MNNTINLLTKKRAPDVRREKLLQALRNTAVIIAIITGASSLVLFLLTVNPAISSIKEQENNVVTNLAFSRGKISKYLILKDRLSAIAAILQARYDMGVAMADLQQQLPDTVSIKTLTIENKVLSFSIAASSLQSIQVSIANMTASLQQKQLFKTITLNTIIADPNTQTYTLAVKADLL